MAISMKGWKRDELEKASIVFDLGRLRAAISRQDQRCCGRRMIDRAKLKAEK